MPGNLVGFSTICKEKLNYKQWDFVLSNFSFYDISFGQLNLFSPDKVFSVQSLFYGFHEPCSLCRNLLEFNVLMNELKRRLRILKSYGYSSAIFGSPTHRLFKGDFCGVEIVEKRLREIVAAGEEFDVIIYFEALPSHISDILNNHKDLLIYSNTIHVDFATCLWNNENFDMLEKNIDRIARFHISVPGYSSNFSAYPTLMEVVKYLLGNNKKCTVEVQSIESSFEDDIEGLLKLI